MWAKLLGQPKSDRLFERRGINMESVIEREGKMLVAIPMEEYKELLEIKGKYEEVLRREEACKKAEPIIWRDGGNLNDRIKPDLTITC